MEHDFFWISWILFDKIFVDLILNSPNQSSIILLCLTLVNSMLQQRDLKNVLLSMTDNNVADTTEDGQRKQGHYDNGIRSSSLMGFSKDQGEVGTDNLPKGVSGKRKSNTFIQKQVSVAVEVVLHCRRQKSLLFLLKNINLKDRSASTASVHLLHLLHRHRHRQSPQRLDV